MLQLNILQFDLINFFLFLLSLNETFILKFLHFLYPLQQFLILILQCIFLSLQSLDNSFQFMCLGVHLSRVLLYFLPRTKRNVNAALDLSVLFYSLLPLFELNLPIWIHYLAHLKRKSHISFCNSLNFLFVCLFLQFSLFLHLLSLSFHFIDNSCLDLSVDFEEIVLEYQPFNSPFVVSLLNLPLLNILIAGNKLTLNKMHMLLFLIIFLNKMIPLQFQLLLLHKNQFILKIPISLVQLLISRHFYFVVILIISVAMIVILIVGGSVLTVPDYLGFLFAGRLTLSNPGNSSFLGLLDGFGEVVVTGCVGVDHSDYVVVSSTFFVHFCQLILYQSQFSQQKIAYIQHIFDIIGGCDHFEGIILTCDFLSIYHKRIFLFLFHNSNIPIFLPGPKDMLKNISNKLKTTSTRPYKSPKSLQHSRIQSFDTYFQDLMHRKNHQCHLIQTPQLNQRIEEIHTHFNNVLASSLSSPTTPSTKTHKRLERKKYQALKQKIYISVQEFHQLDLTNLKLLFSLKQKILNDFLNQFTQQITKQCRQKGDILTYIWNSMFSMIEHISQQLSKQLREKEQLQLKHNIAQHKSYQEMLENIKQKHDQLKDQNDVEKTAIAKLIYELRYKRKEINRLYKTQKTLENKLNQLKTDNIHIKTNYIDIVSSLKDLPPQSVEQMLKARSQLNRDKQVKIKVKNNKKNNHLQIEKELGTTSNEAMGQLLFQIKQIAKAESNSPKVISTLINAAIQNFGISHDDTKNMNSQLIQVHQTNRTSDVQIQVNLMPNKHNSKIQQITQTSNSDKINFNLIQNKVTQTFNQFNQKKVIFDTQGTMTQDISKKYVDWYFSISQVCAQKIQGKVEEDKVVSPPIKFDRHGKKKHMSDVNMQINWRNSSKKNTIFSQKQEEIENRFKKKQSTDSQLSHAIDRQFQKINEKGLLNSKKDGLLQNTSKKSRKSAMALSRKSIDLSRRGSKKGSPQIKQTESEVNRDSYVNRSSVDSQQMTSSVLIKKRRKATNITTNQYQKIRQEFANIKFLDNNRKSFNINIDQNKQTEIYNIFVKNRKSNFYFDLNQMSQQDDSQKQFQNDMISRTFQQIQQINKRQKGRKQTTCSLAKNLRKSQEDQMGQEQQNMLLNVCRDKYYQKNRKKRERGSIMKYRDQFTSVKDKIQMIAKDVGSMMVDKQDYLKKTVNNKNIKTLYKILMMTFAKAYDCYNKGIVISNLVFPLFESFSLIYGNINTSQVYKRMINFIAFLSVKTDNGIFKFFLFFLGLDKKSAYSQHVSICEVYLCLALLQKISVQSKVTLNIDSIYTDTNRIKEQLIGVLREQKIPECLCIQIKRKVDEQLQNSSVMKNSDDIDAQLKVNIYNIILLIIQEVIKCKLKMKESFKPLLQCCPQFQQDKRIPIALLQSLLSMCVTTSEQREIVVRLTGILRKKYSCGTLQFQQFYSILFENNLISMTQVMEQNYLPLYRVKIPQQFNSYVTDSIIMTRINFNTQLEHFEYELYSKLIAIKTFKNGQEKTTVQIMKKLIFIKTYFKKADSLWKQVVGLNLSSLIGEL